MTRHFRLEWKLAADRSHLFAPDRAFLLPVVIDDTPQTDKRIPDRFREVQWSRLPSGEATPAFVERGSRLLFSVLETEVSRYRSAGENLTIPARAPATIVVLTHAVVPNAIARSVTSDGVP